jgi:integrase
MPRKATELSPLAVSKLRKRGLHAVGGVAGLHLQVTEAGARSWVLRVRLASGKRRDMGLGGFPDVTLAQARDRARIARDKVDAGLDPIAARIAERSAQAAAQASAWTFEQCAKACIKTRAAEWSNAKHAGQWSATLETYAYPVLGHLLVRDITHSHVLAALQPIWHTRTETATRVRSRIEIVLDWATASGHREGPNPARWRGLLDKLLPNPSKIAPVEHHRALPASAMPNFMRAVRAQEGMGARALEFAILTATRSGEVRGATWAEIDFDAKVWTVPKERMKAGTEHQVPLAPAVIALLRSLVRIKDVEFVFPAPRGGVLSDMTLTAVTRRMGVEAVPHGFRSTFRTWAAESTNHPREVAEHALAHKLPDKVEAAYQRGSLFAKRVALMRDWADFLSKPTAAVVPIRAKRATGKAGA